MKLIGFLMLLAGWVIVFFAGALLRAGTPRIVFVLAGMGVEVLGFALVARSHITMRGNRG